MFIRRLYEKSRCNLQQHSINISGVHGFVSFTVKHHSVLHNTKKRFIVVVVSDLRNMILK